MIQFREVLAVFIAAGAVWGQTAAAPARPRGYLSQAETASVLRIVPPAPATGDPRFETDMAIFRATRSLEGSARWELARSDDNLSVGGLLKAFACAMKLNLTVENAPKLAALLGRASSDAGAAANVIKIHYQHKRPFQVAEGDVCLSPLGKANLERSPDYPSGHTAISWDVALILAELSPNEAADILARARAFGQSRVVCGVHNLSAVESGWMTGTAVFAMQGNSAEFRKDLEAVKAEIAARRVEKDGQPAGCEAEAKTLAASPY